MSDGFSIATGVAVAGFMIAHGLNALGKWICLTWNPTEFYAFEKRQKEKPNQTSEGRE